MFYCSLRDRWLSALTNHRAVVKLKRSTSTITRCACWWNMFQKMQLLLALLSPLFCYDLANTWWVFTASRCLPLQRQVTRAIAKANSLQQTNQLVSEYKWFFSSIQWLPGSCQPFCRPVWLRLKQPFWIWHLKAYYFLCCTDRYFSRQNT